MDKKQQLLSVAHSVFLKKGFKNTNVSDITKKANMAVGTFYNFFDSKLAIFLQVYNDENERTKAVIINNLDIDGDPITVVQTALNKIIEQSKNNKILQEWFTNEEIHQQIEKNSQNSIENSIIYTTFIELINRWQELGLLATGMTESRIVSMFNAVIVVDIHQNEIETQNYFQLLNDLLTAILKVILK